MTDTARDKAGDAPVVTKKLLGHIDNSSYPLVTVDIQLTVTIPENAPGLVPFITEFDFIFGSKGPGGKWQGGKGGPTWQQQLLARLSLCHPQPE